MRLFSRYCSEQEQSSEVDLAVIPVDNLAKLVGSFYVDAKTRTGSPFSKNSLLAAGGALQRHLSAVRQVPVNIFTDETFSKANKLLDGVLKARKRAGDEPAVQTRNRLHRQILTNCRSTFKIFSTPSMPSNSCSMSGTNSLSNFASEVVRCSQS